MVEPKIDAGTSALVVSGLTFVGLVIDKFVIRRNSKEATAVQQQQADVALKQAATAALTAQSTANKTDSDTIRDLMKQAQEFHGKILKNESDIGRLTRTVRHLKLDLQVAIGTLTLCQKENELLKEYNDDLTESRDKWRASAKSAWQVIDDTDMNRAEPEYRRIADVDYIEAKETEERLSAQEQARRTALADLTQQKAQTVAQASALARIELDEQEEADEAT